MSEAQAGASGFAEGSLIAGAYRIDGGLLLPGAGGGLPAYGVIDHRHGRRELMAVQMQRAAPARAQTLNALSSLRIESLLAPLAHGATTTAPSGPDGRGTWYVVCPRPPGPALDTVPGGLTPWSEAEILDCVLRPAALALDQLAHRHVTHRAIRPNNVFRAGPGMPVSLGCAWAAPPGSLQPDVFEPPYSALCHPAGRGEGTVADDVYALGVLLITLATGRVPLAGMDAEAILQRKLERGSFAALAGDSRLPPVITDLVRGMLAEIPDHRPPPVLLADPLAARARRVAARPAYRAQRPLELGRLAVWNVRGLAHAMARAPDQALRLLKGGAIDTWLRRGLGDPALAARIDEIVRSQAEEGENAAPTRADSLLALRVVAALDPLAPLVWNGVSLFPDGLGSLLVADDTEDGPSAEDLTALILTDAIGTWADARPEHCDVALLRLDSRGHRLMLRITGWAGGLPRLRYALNQLLPCRSPALGPACVVRLADLLPALELAAAARTDLSLDREIGAFIAARFVGKVDPELMILAQAPDSNADSPGQRGLVQLRILAALQASNPVVALPALAGAARQAVLPALAVWRNRSQRVAREEALAQAAQAGRLGAMLAVLEDQAARAADSQAAKEAHAEIVQINDRLAGIAAEAGRRAEQARRTGEEIAVSIGIVAAVVAVVMTVLG